MPARVRTGLAVAVVAVVVAATVSGCGSHGTDAAAKTKQAATTSSSPSPSPTGTNATLAQAVLAASEAPPGTTYVSKDSGRQSLVDVLHNGKDAAANQAKLRAAGFRDAYRSLFIGTPTTASLGASQRSLASFALVFPDAASARKVAALIDGSVRSSGSSVHALPDPGLGQTSTALQSALPSLDGSTFYYSWVDGTAVRVLVDAGGKKATDPSTSLALAKSMASGPAGTPGPGTAASALVLTRSEAPPSAAYDSARSGPRTAKDFGGVTATLTQLKLRSAYATLFRTSGLIPQKASGASPTNVVSSQAQQYTTATNASRAYHVFVDRQKKLFQGHSAATELTSSGLGAEGYGFRYVDQKSTGDIVGIGYFWRVGNLVLSLSVVGSSTFATEAEARKLADEVDARLT